MKISPLLLAALLSAGAIGGGEAAERRFVSIGTGGVAGVYYPAGGAICRLVNEAREAHGVRCSAEPTGGSVYNINTVRAGELEFGLAQSDWQFHAFEGTSRFRGQGRFEDLRAVFALHPEPVTLVVRGGSGIRDFTDLEGRRVNVDGPGAAERATVEVLLDAYGMSADDFSAATALEGSELTRALCDGGIDAALYTVGHPATAITEVSNTCDVDFVDLTGPVIDELVATHPYYRVASVPAGLYKGLDEDLATFGVGATLVTSTAVPADIVYIVTKAVFEHVDDLRKLHPAFVGLEERSMIEDGLPAPLHEGAVRYYRERGWM